MLRPGEEGDGVSWLEALYSTRLSKHDHTVPADERFAALDSIHGVAETTDGSGAVVVRPESLASNAECVLAHAASRYYQHDPQGALQLTRWVECNDPLLLTLSTESAAVHFRRREKCRTQTHENSCFFRCFGTNIFSRKIN